VLTGVLFEGEGDELRVVATDSYRLAVRTLGAQGVDGVRVLVPSRATSEVARLAGGKQVRVELSSSQIGFNVDDALVQSRLIEGEFPAYRQLLPETLPNTLRVSKAPFVESIKRVAVLAQDATPIFLELSSERIRISCHAQGLGEAAEDVDGDYVGEEMRAAFNATYLEAGIAATEGDEVVIDMSDPQRPALIHAPDDRQFLYLLMPIRVS
jgi:DNA polymerase-3 subunit beta